MTEKVLMEIVLRLGQAVSLTEAKRRKIDDAANQLSAYSQNELREMNKKYRDAEAEYEAASDLTKDSVRNTQEGLTQLTQNEVAKADRVISESEGEMLQVLTLLKGALKEATDLNRSRLSSSSSWQDRLNNIGGSPDVSDPNFRLPGALPTDIHGDPYYYAVENDASIAENTDPSISGPPLSPDPRSMDPMKVDGIQITGRNDDEMGLPGINSAPPQNPLLADSPPSYPTPAPKEEEKETGLASVGRSPFSPSSGTGQDLKAKVDSTWASIPGLEEEARREGYPMITTKPLSALRKA